jgi:hypothetical protein
MRRDDAELLKMFQFELRFLEDGGYGRSPRTPWRASYVFEDSPPASILMMLPGPTCATNVH